MKYPKILMLTLGLILVIGIIIGLLLGPSVGWTPVLTSDSTRLSLAESFQAIPLHPPPFIEAASAADILQSGTAFPVDSAGIAAYVNVGQTINLQNASRAFSRLLESSQNHVIGIVPIQNSARVITNVTVYVDVNGYIVAYFNETLPSSNLVNWAGMNYTNPSVNFTTHTAIQNVCVQSGINYNLVKGNIQFYHFGYPSAQRMLIILDTLSPGTTEYTHLTIPLNYSMYEGSYSLVGIPSTHCELYLDDQFQEEIYYVLDSNDLVTNFYDIGANLTKGSPHTISIVNKANYNAGSATALIYTEG